jgi:PadR family transcriptional regulator, phenolic acid-responsive transcriptional regulator
MSLEHILIGLLRQPASGYDLKKVFDERIDYFWAAELSQIYPTLKRLEKRGWVRGRQAVSSRGPGRCVYETTPAGRRALRDWLARGPQIGDERFAYLAQIYSMDELGDLNQTLRFFTVLRDHFARKLEGLRRLERYWAEADPRYPDSLPLSDFHVQLTLRMGLVSLGGHVRSCDESIRRLRARIEKEKNVPVPISKASGTAALHSSLGRGFNRHSPNRQPKKARAKR